MQPDQTTVWGALSVTNPQGSGLVFIDPSTFQPVTSVANFSAILGKTPFNTGALYLANDGDITGNDALNLGCQGDSYVPQTLQNLGTVGMSSGFTVSTSRGTRAVPTVSLDTDYIGEFSGYAALSVAGTLTYKLLSAIKHYVSGASAIDPGGKLRLGTKLNAGVYTEWLELDNLGNLSPVVTGTSRLGIAAKGFAALTLDYTNTGTIGAVVINKPTGSANIAAGASSVVVTNNLVTANSIVLAVLQFQDATLTFLRAVVPAAGSFTINGNANATANTRVGFLVINTDS